MIFLYYSLEWTTGDASGGSHGLGGTMARAGINAGDGVHSFTLSASGNQQAMLSLTTKSNLNQPGIYVLRDKASLYPYGRRNLGATDDGGRAISFQFPFYGSTRTSAYVSMLLSMCKIVQDISFIFLTLSDLQQWPHFLIWNLLSRHPKTLPSQHFPCNCRSLLG